MIFVRGLRAITADTALRLSRYFGTSPELWVNLQAQYELEIAERTARRQIEREVRREAALCRQTSPCLAPTSFLRSARGSGARDGR